MTTAIVVHEVENGGVWAKAIADLGNFGVNPGYH